MKVTPVGPNGQPLVPQQATAPTPDPKPPVAADPSAVKPPAASVEGSKPSPDTDNLSPKFQELARKESTIRKVAAQLKQKEAELASNYISKADLSKDLVGTLLSAGITPEALKSLFPQQPAQPQTESVNPDIAALKAEIEALKQGKVDGDKQAYENAVKQLKRDTSNLVDSDPEFATIKAANRHGDVVELIEKNYKATGEIWTVEQAAKLVEEELRSEFAKYAALPTIQKKLAPPTEEPTTPTSDPKSTQSTPKKRGMPVKVTPRNQPVSNLTHKLNSNRPLTVRERAIAAFNGNNK